MILPFFRRPFHKLCMSPSFLIVGAQKAGTTSLFKYLIEHPEIAAPSKKEVHYFDIAFNTGNAWYRSHFPLRKTGMITGEASPYYLFHPCVPERAYRFDADLKIIVLLRDPVLRAYSHYHHEARKNREKRPLIQALTGDATKIDEISAQMMAGTVMRSPMHQNHSYLARGRYAEQLDRWLRYFPRHQIHLQTSERFFSDPASVCAEIFNFLEIANTRVPVETQHNAGNYQNTLPADAREFLANHFMIPNQDLKNRYGVDTDAWIGTSK